MDHIFRNERREENSKKARERRKGRGQGKGVVGKGWQGGELRRGGERGTWVES